MNIELLNEPLLEFGNDFLCDDPKTGITRGGFFSLTSSNHRSEIHYGIVGTNFGIEKTIEWVNSMSVRIEASITEIEEKIEANIEDGEVTDMEITFDEEVDLIERSEDFNEGEDLRPSIQKKTLNPDFPGFNQDTSFKCSFVNDNDNNMAIKQLKLNAILEDTDIKSFDKAVRVCDLYIEAFKAIVDRSMSAPNVVFLVIPAEVFKKLSSLPYKKGQNFNLRRYLKAQIIACQKAIPVQIILEDTVLQKKRSMQDLSMQAWNLIVANYYKNNGIPWTLSLNDKHTCFIGISFNKVINGEAHLVRSSVAQAFNYEGKGIVFIGKQFEWDVKEMNTPAPHLTYDYSKDLIQRVISEYKSYNHNLPPKRVVIHKTTDFWNSSINKDYAETEGLKDGIRNMLGDDVEIDLVTIKSSPIKLLRMNGDTYPVIRGVLCSLSKSEGILYTTGYIPYYETFPGSHIPHPLDISIVEGESTLKKVCEEILALTKMNFNNCNYYDSLPITIRFAKKVGEIIQYMEEGVVPPNKYYHYM